jgi:hypothetical protein
MTIVIMYLWFCTYGSDHGDGCVLLGLIMIMVLIMINI